MTAAQLVLTTALAAAAAVGYGLYRRRRRAYLRRDSWQAQRPLYLSAGFAVAIGLVAAAFEYTVPAEPTGSVASERPVGDLDEIAVVPRTATPPPALPPPPRPDPLTAQLLTVEDLPEPPTFEDARVELPPKGPAAADGDPGALPGAGAAVPPPLPTPPPPPPPPIDETPLIFAERMPMFPGCEGVEDAADERACAEERMLAYLYDELHYPALARENRVQGRAIVQFTVERDGAITEVTVVRSPKAGIDAEARRVVEGFPRWTPGRQGGRPVRVRFTLPIEFRLE